VARILPDVEARSRLKNTSVVTRFKNLKQAIYIPSRN
jgi:hypothetical protein